MRRRKQPVRLVRPARRPSAATKPFEPITPNGASPGLTVNVCPINGTPVKLITFGKNSDNTSVVAGDTNSTCRPSPAPCMTHPAIPITARSSAGNACWSDKITAPLSVPGGMFDVVRWIVVVECSS